MNMYEIVLEKYSLENVVLGVFYYSEFFQPNGEKRLHSWLRSHHKASYAPKEKIVFVQDQADVYDYRDDLGKCTQEIQKAIETIDISPCFVTIITTNPNIQEELKTASAIKSISNETMQSVIIEGPYEPNLPERRNTFCILPWTHLYIGPEGDVLPCCMGNQDYPIGHIDQSGIEEIYNNQNFVNLRQRMLDGKRTKECSHCWLKEDSGLPSPRLLANSKYQDAIQKFELVADKVELKPKYIDIRLNKLCNLKCRSCSPYYSSAIAQEIKEIYNVQWPALNNQKRQSGLQEILKILPSVESIYFAGGEPLLLSEHFEMLSELIRINHVDINLRYSTNFMQLSYKNHNFLDIWQNFSNVILNASLDARGREAEYLRHGTVWSQIEQNLAAVNQRNLSNLKLLVHSTIGFLNVESLIDLQVEWSEKQILPLENFKSSAIIFDSYLSPQVLPEHHKQRLESIVSKHIKWVQSKNASDLANRWQQYIDYMWAEDRSHLLPEFQRLTLSVDRHRGESFHKTFPQFADLMPLSN